MTMETLDRQWIVTRVDGKISSIALDYRHFASIAKSISALNPGAIGKVETSKISTSELVELKSSVKWEDLRLFGTKFQLGVWERLFSLEPRLYSYTEFAALCGNPQGVRPVAHAVGINPVTFIIPCHLIIPKESMDKAKFIRKSAESTLFKGSDLYLLDTIDVGEFAWGPDVKRELIKLHLR